MIEVIVAVDPRPNTKARHFVSVAQALGRGLIRPCCHARKRDRFSAHRKYQQILDRLDLLRHVAPPFTHFFPRRAKFLIRQSTRDRPKWALRARNLTSNGYHFGQFIRELSCSPLERCCYASSCLQPVADTKSQFICI